MADKQPGSPTQDHTHNQSFHTDGSYAERARKGLSTSNAVNKQEIKNEQQRLEHEIREFNGSAVNNARGIQSSLGTGISVQANFGEQGELKQQLKSIPGEVVQAPGKFIKNLKSIASGQGIPASDPGAVHVGLGVGGTDIQNAQNNGQRLSELERQRNGGNDGIAPGPLNKDAHHAAAHIMNGLQNKGTSLQDTNGHNSQLHGGGARQKDPGPAHTRS